MATEILPNFDSIEEKLLKAKSNLKGLNENIRRIIGREPADNQLRLEIVFIFELRSLNDGKLSLTFSYSVYRFIPFAEATGKRIQTTMILDATNVVNSINKMQEIAETVHRQPSDD